MCRAGVDHIGRSVTHRVGFSICFAVSAGVWASMCGQIRTNFLLGEPSRELFEVSFLATARQCRDMVFKKRPMNVRSFLIERVREVFGAPRPEHFFRGELRLGSHTSPF